MRSIAAGLSLLLLSILPSHRLAAGVDGSAGQVPAPATHGAVATGGREVRSTARKPAPAPPHRATPARSVEGWRRGPSGFATYYAKSFDGKVTASGTIFDNDDMLAAHPSYSFGTVVRVTNLRNGRSVEVLVVDRGPTRSARASGVVIDLSRAAAEKLGFIEDGRTRVRLDVSTREPQTLATD